VYHDPAAPLPPPDPSQHGVLPSGRDQPIKRHHTREPACHHRQTARSQNLVKPEPLPELVADVNRAGAHVRMYLAVDDDGGQSDAIGSSDLVFDHCRISARTITGTIIGTRIRKPPPGPGNGIEGKADYHSLASSSDHAMKEIGSSALLIGNGAMKYRAVHLT
jgi:hypothetical protein